MSKITRRDFVNGALIAAGTAMLPRRAQSAKIQDAQDPAYYPPSQTGLRGSHPGSNAYAHAMALDGEADFGPVTTLSEEYDLVVVGGGISGLAAAYYYRQKHGQDKKVLILAQSPLHHRVGNDLMCSTDHCGHGTGMVSVDLWKFLCRQLAVEIRDARRKTFLFCFVNAPRVLLR